MAFLHFEGIGITAMSACVPGNVINNYEYGTDIWSVDEVRKVVDKIGVYQRRFTDGNTCSSDLCVEAANELFNDNCIDRRTIDVLVFLSQTPDYRMPATSILLQHRLGLSKGTMAFDINLGCSGFISALSIVYSLMQNASVNRVLLLNGETRSKVYNKKDRRSAFLFGDAGVAVLVERDLKFGRSSFSINSDGSLGNLIMIPGGGYRTMSSMDTLQERIVDEYGNIRSEENGYMLGEDVFNFVIKAVPSDINSLLNETRENIHALDYYVFHQANRFINNYLAKKLKLDSGKIPWSIHKFGNTSSVSIPLTIISELKDHLAGNKKLLLSAFGVGMAWGSAIVPLVDCKISDIIEYGSC